VDTEQPDPDAAVAFYRGTFGWTFEDRLPPGAPGRYLIASLDGLDVAAVASPPEGGSGPPAWNTYVAVADADETASRVLDAGGSVVVAPYDVGPPGRMAVCADPTGAAFRLWQPGARKGAQLVNAPGSWNWSDLHTPEPERAVPFYAAVFGWRAVPVDLGGDQATMWCRPGYGDVLAERDPELRRRHGEAGVPAGFSDAVGWLVPLPEGAEAGEEAPSWTVTFAVDDTDAVTDRAAALGATVAVAPFDAGPARLAVLRDPQGATFTVSRYQPA
jgi:predicted enzyme related to lactoylglutathione lyase